MLKRLKSERGISLLEVLFATFVGIVSVFSVMMVYPKMKVLSQSGEYKMAAIHVAQSLAETYRQAGFENVFSGTTTSVATLSEGKDLASDADDVLAEVTTTISDISDNGFVIGRVGVIEVEWVTNNWSDPGTAEIVKEVVNFVVFDNARPDTSGSGYSDPSKKTTLCHTVPTNHITLTVGNPAVAAHLAHGDYLGECVEEEE